MCVFKLQYKLDVDQFVVQIELFALCHGEEPRAGNVYLFDEVLSRSVF